MRRLLTSCAAIILALSCSQAFAQEGGFKDPNTGKVWSLDHDLLDRDSGDWEYSMNYAANYGIWDVDSEGILTYYADWRLPTEPELQAAIANGTIQWVNQNSSQMRTSVRQLYWTSTRKGRKVRAVWIQFGPNGEVIQNGSSETLVFRQLGENVFLNSYLIRP